MRKFINFSLILCILFMVSGCANLMEEKNTENRIVIDMRQSRAAISWDEVSSWCVLIEKIPENVNVTKDILDDYSSLGKFLEKNYPNPNLEELKPSQKYYESEELDPASYLVVIGLFKDSRKDDPFAFGAGIVNVEAGKTAEADILVRCVAERSNTDLFSIVWMMKTPDPRFKDFYVYSGAYFVKENDSSKIYLVYSNGQGKYWKQLMHTDVQVTVTGCEYAFCSKKNPNGFVIKYDEAQNGIYDGSMLYVRDDGADIEKLNASAPMTDTTFVNEDNGFKKRDDGGNSTSVSLENLLDTVWITPSYESINGYDAFKGLYMTVESGKVRIYDVIANDSTYWLYDNESCQNLTITYDVSGEIKILSKDITKAEFCYNPSTGSIEAYSQGLQYIQLKDELIKYPQVQYDESFINKEFGFKETSGGSFEKVDMADNLVGIWIKKDPDDQNGYCVYKGYCFEKTDSNQLQIYGIESNKAQGGTCWKTSDCGLYVVAVSDDGQYSLNDDKSPVPFSYIEDDNGECFTLGENETLYKDQSYIDLIDAQDKETPDFITAANGFDHIARAILGKVWVSDTPQADDEFYYSLGYYFAEEDGCIKMHDVVSNGSGGYWKVCMNNENQSVKITASDNVYKVRMASNSNEKTFTLSGNILSLPEGSSAIEYMLKDIEPETMTEVTLNENDEYSTFMSVDNGFRKCLSDDELLEFLGNVYRQHTYTTVTENGNKYKVFQGYYIEESSDHKVTVYNVVANGSENGGWLASTICEDACICKQDDTYNLFTTFGYISAHFTYDNNGPCIYFNNSETECLLDENANKDHNIKDRLFTGPQCYETGNFEVMQN